MTSKSIKTNELDKRKKQLNVVLYSFNHDFNKQIISALIDSESLSFIACFDGINDFENHISLLRPNYVLIEYVMYDQFLKSNFFLHNLTSREITFVFLKFTNNNLKEIICLQSKYLPKNIDCIRSFLVKYFGRTIIMKVLNHVSSNSISNPVINRPTPILSKKELTVLKLLAKGNSIKMVADELQVSVNTVKTFLKRAYFKLNAHSITEAIFKIFGN